MLNIGDKAPDFTLPDQNGGQCFIKKLFRQKSCIMVFSQKQVRLDEQLRVKDSVMNPHNLNKKILP
ncbi:MAG: hypothetical protein Ct9H90mP7_1340 [Candidatus Neomarinimicrobiota bacterium]|nr:MAG: hypothetical protein Ct9H90mP7_1340 [Candidatus Neomarinimicrobiota bacterium]